MAPSWQAAAIVAGASAAALAAAWPILGWLEVYRLEKPKYVVVKNLGKYKSWLTGKPLVELRRYAPYLIAEVTVESADGDMRKALYAGFRQLAKYIFGDNKAAGQESAGIAMTSPVQMEVGEPRREAIAMTSPVQMEVGTPQSENIKMTSPVAAEPSADGKTWKIAFVMPSKFTLDNIPKPNNSAVQLREVPAHTLAAISWNGGIPSPAVMEQYKAKLLSVLAEEGIEVEGEPKLYQYHPPFLPPFVRVNEVLYAVKE